MIRILNRFQNIDTSTFFAITDYLLLIIIFNLLFISMRTLCGRISSELTSPHSFVGLASLIGGGTARMFDGKSETRNGQNDKKVPDVDTTTVRDIARMCGGNCVTLPGYNIHIPHNYTNLRLVSSQCSLKNPIVRPIQPC